MNRWISLRLGPDLIWLSFSDYQNNEVITGLEWNHPSDFTLLKEIERWYKTGREGGGVTEWFTIWPAWSGSSHRGRGSPIQLQAGRRGEGRGRGLRPNTLYVSVHACGFLGKTVTNDTDYPTKTTRDRITALNPVGLLYRVFGWLETFVNVWNEAQISAILLSK